MDRKNGNLNRQKMVFLHPKITIMKKVLLFILFICLSVGYAQIVTPGNGTQFTFSDLVNDPSGAITSPETGIFILTQDLTISANDSLLLDSAMQSLQIVGDVTITVLGCVQCEERSNLLEITGIQTDSSPTFFEWRFEEAAPSLLSHLRMENGENIFIGQTQISIQNCEFSNFNSQVIKYMNCNPIILHCDFHDNRQAAINSAVNVTGSPIICYNRFYHNVLDDVNQPQINLGPGTNGRDIIIEGNTIDGCSPMSGGIAIANLMNVGLTQAVIRNNIIENNRYGYTQQGSDIFALIEDNQFINNNLEENPMNGGSGISIYGSDTTCAAKLRRNIISGNLWGITAINKHTIDMGTAEDFGHNRLFDNGNGGQIYALYNNASSSMSAVGNYWGGNTEAFVESVIYHRPDLGNNYGLVLYAPILTEDTTEIADSEEISMVVYPNPTNGIVNIQLSSGPFPHTSEIQIFDIYGRRLQVWPVKDERIQIDLSGYSKGIYFFAFVTNRKKTVSKVVVE